MQALNLRLTRDNLSRPWGFRLQGGLENGVPLSVQRVFSGSPAEGILQRGDVIRHLENSEVSGMTSKEVQDVIRASGRQLNFIVERDPSHIAAGDEENVGGGVENGQEPQHRSVSVQLARKKFLNSDNRAPPPFGHFGTQYEPKLGESANQMPTGLKLEMDNSFHQEEMTPKARADPHTSMTSSFNEEEKIDYSFMTLPVSERKKIFGTGDANWKTEPRLRTYSHRPAMARPQQHYNSNTTGGNRSGPQFGWGPSKEAMSNARIMPTRRIPAQSTSSASRLQQHQPPSSPYVSSGRGFFPDSNTVPRRFSSSATIPRAAAGRIWLPNDSGLNTLPSARHVYRGGLASTSTTGNFYDRRSMEPMHVAAPAPVSQTGALYVRTYTDYPSTSPQSPRMFKPAYPAYSKNESSYQNQHNLENMSTISVRSEPYSRFEDRGISYDNPGVYHIRQQRDITPVPSTKLQQQMCAGMDRLHMGAPRTRVVASPSSPSYQLNQPFWDSSRAPRTTASTAAPLRMVVHVPKSQSTVTINQARHHNYNSQPQQHSHHYQQQQHNPEPPVNDEPHESVYSQVAWLKQHRDSLAGASDF